MGKKPAKQSTKAAASSKGAATIKAAAASSKGAAAKVKAGKKQRGAAASSSSSGYDSLRDPLDRQLALLGLRVKNITADGNCFFRALSDQLQGDEALHSDIRSRVCGLMHDKADDFAPFVEDDQTLDTYLARMKREGVWAGHMELQAASLLVEVNIAIYQAGQPRWCITNFPPGSRMLHLSYHDGEHYNSVRRADDYSRGTAADIPDSLTPIADVAQAQQCWGAADEARVAEGTGCDNPVLIRQQLQAAGGDVDAAIEAVIDIMGGEDIDGEVEGIGLGLDKAGGDTAGGAAAAAAAAAGSAAAGCEDTSSAQPVSITAGEHSQTDSSSTHAAAASSSPAAAAAEEDEQVAAAAEAEAEAATCAGQQAQSEASSSSPTVATQPQQEHSGSAAAAAAAAAADGAPSSSINSTRKGSSSKSKGVKLKGGNSSSSSVVSGKRCADKAPSRNKPCPCGSGRKHKNCCGGGGGGSGKAAVGVGDSLPAALGTLHI